MRIDTLRNRTAAGPGARRAAPARDGAFATTLAATGGDRSTGTAAPPAVRALIGVDTVETATDRRSRGLAIQHGEDILDQLGSLQRDILAGSVSPARLLTLTQTLRSKAESGTLDPRLAEVMAEIELRAEVELAKLEARS